MNGFTPRAVWMVVRRARLLRVLAVYLTSAFVVLQAVDILVDRLGLPDWFFPGAFILLLVGLPILVATAVVQSTPAAPDPQDAAARPAAEAGRAAGASSPARTAMARHRTDGAPSFTEVTALAREWLTWHRAIAGGILAFTLLVLAVSGYSLMRTLGIGPIGSLVAAGVLDAREPLLIADFESPSGDTVLASVATHAFRVDFSQSPVVAVVDPGTIREVLQRMERDPASRLSPELAREAARRAGIKAMVTGEIAAAGAGYVVSAALVVVESHAILAAFRETAASDDAIIPAIDQLSKRLRERIGESLRTIRTNPPLEQVTTGSLDALVRYTQAVHATDVVGDDERAIALLEEAIALDPGFAMAHRKLAAVLDNRGIQRARRIEAATSAYRHRDRLTEYERYLTMAHYHHTVTGDVAQAILAYRTLLSLVPDNAAALNNLGVLYWRQQDWERAEEHYLAAWRVDSTAHLPLTNLIGPRYNRSTGEARATIERVRELFPGLPQYYHFAAGLAEVEGRYADAAGLLQQLIAERPDDVTWRIIVHNRLAILARLQGRLAEAERHLEAAARENEQRGSREAALTALLNGVQADVLVRGDPARARAGLAEALSRYPLETIDPFDRPWVLLGRALAGIGEPERIRALIAEADREFGPSPLHDDVRRGRYALEAALAEAEGRWSDALRLLPQLNHDHCVVCGLILEARLRDTAGDTDAAIAGYERYLETRYLWRTDQDSFYRAHAFERLADLHEQRGDLEKARLYLAGLMELWQDADPELQPRARAAEQRLARLIAPG